MRRHEFTLSLALCLIGLAHAAPPRLLGPPIKQHDSVDHACLSDADCILKNVRACCGTDRACVNRDNVKIDSRTIPPAPATRCMDMSAAGVCNAAPVASCACFAGRCAPQPKSSLQAIK